MPSSSLAAHGGYEFVEVYSDGTYRAISSDGAVSVVHLHGVPIGAVGGPP